MSAAAGFRGSRWAIALAMSLSPLAWYGAQQGLGVLLRVRCSVAAGPGAAVGVLGLLACALAGWLSITGRGGSGLPAQTDAVLRTLALLGAGVFGLAIGFQTLAVLIVPSCAR